MIYRSIKTFFQAIQSEQISYNNIEGIEKIHMRTTRTFIQKLRHVSHAFFFEER